MPEVAATYEPDPAFVTRTKKRLHARRFPGRSHADFAPDCLIPSALGGAAQDERNVWLQPYFSVANVQRKNQLEDVLLDLVCSGHMTIAAAQQAVATDWITAYAQVVDAL